MHIKRVQIEEGFLDGLDVDLSPGLNAIIGARGTGKTSLIEIIRYCLDVNNATTESTRRSRDHALSVLGSGQATVTLSDGENTVLVSRTASDKSPRASAAFQKPVIFSQTEIETVGLESTGRLSLIDGFITSTPQNESIERELITECRALTQKIEAARRDLEDLEQTQSALPILQQELESVIAAEENVSRTSEALKIKTESLSNHSSKISSTSVMLEQASRIRNSVANWSHEIKRGIDQSPIASIDLDSESATTLNPFLEMIEQIKGRLSSNLLDALEIHSELTNLIEDHSRRKVIAEDQARQLRQEIESIQAGSGSVLRRGQELRQSIATLESVSSYLIRKKFLLTDLLIKRSSALDRLDDLRNDRFSARLEAAERLNKNIAPNIKVSIYRNGQPKIFASAISEILRGSGLRYAEAADSISRNLSPRALVEAVDSFDIKLITDAAGITSERAVRLLSHLKNCDLSEISTINVEDEVSLQLLDGTDYKDISELSTGQRCTVILPIVLAHTNRMLLVDQPEDHIDNAFIAQTLIKAILGRGERGQIIFSTHNPNIPVLGRADLVLHLGSDGRRGFRLSSGLLSEENIATAISTVMEGGSAAFNCRAEFYGEHFL